MNQGPKNAAGRGQPPPAFNVSDVWYALFRHKWKILILTCVGIITSIYLYVTDTPPYVSSAKLLLRYIVESKSVESLGPDGQNKTRTTSGENVINSEQEILKSIDLSRQVAETIGPEKILAKAGGGSNVTAAALTIFGGLTVSISPKSNVMHVRCTHPDPEMVQLILHHVIEAYFKRHAEIHRALGTMDAFLAQQTDQVRSRIAQTDEALRNLRTNAGVISLEDSKRFYTTQMSRIRQEILTAETQLASYQWQLTNQVSFVSTNASESTTNAPTTRRAVEEYRAAFARLQSLYNHEMELRTFATDQNRTLKRIREQITETEEYKKKLELENPIFLTLLPSSKDATSPAGQPVDPAGARAHEAKIGFLLSQLEKLRVEAAALEEYETTANPLQRKRELDDQNYRHFVAGLEQARFDEALSAGKLANISVVQTPSPPGLDSTKRLKRSMMALAGGLFGGIGLALLIEMMVDHSVRRPGQIESKLGLPLFLAIPRVRVRKPRLLSRGKKKAAATAALLESKPASLSIPGWSHDHPLRQYMEALRDRTLMHFGGDPHKPKLIGITACREGAGVTTIASALAAALSETGDGRVLLVNLNFCEESVHPFLSGRPVCALGDAMEGDKREAALIKDNLYLANGKGNGAANGHGSTEVLPTSMSRMMPKLKASDYDYIVFDMPRLSRTSVSAKLGGMLDLVFVVVESEKESQDMLKRASELLTENNAKFGVVLNKFRSYAPAWLHQEL